uniref:Leucine-rich repeat-containing N-terminal plant-type domain-containing protein n=2 Tax=Aegilops tauschii subsp. strangulata TaxID=200361 RepID=A0A453HW98_AEGTS
DHARDATPWRLPAPRCRPSHGCGTASGGDAAPGGLPGAAGRSARAHRPAGLRLLRFVGLHRRPLRLRRGLLLRRWPGRHAGPRGPARRRTGPLGRIPLRGARASLRAQLALARPRPRFRGVILRRRGAPVAPLPSLRFLALSGNLPGAFSPALRTVDLSKNSFSGRIPSSLLQIRSLRTLVLSHNSLSGEIPKTVSSPLVHLDLRNNRLSGGVPPLPVTVVYLSLAGNRLSGRVGGVLRRLTRLSFLDLGGNWFSGEEPGEVFSFRIGYLQLRKNAFSDELRPAGRLPSGSTVDLSHNALSGRVPAELASAAAVYLNGNKFAGAVPAEIVAAAEGGRMRVLFLQDNFLTGISVRGLPSSAPVCAHWNCVAPPPTVVAACPAKGGRGRRRPPAQCGGRRG